MHQLFSMHWASTFSAHTCHPQHCMHATSFSFLLQCTGSCLSHRHGVEQSLGQDVTVEQLSRLALVGQTAAADLLPLACQAHQQYSFNRDQVTGDSGNRNHIAQYCILTVRFACCQKSEGHSFEPALGHQLFFNIANQIPPCKQLFACTSWVRSDHGERNVLLHLIDGP